MALVGIGNILMQDDGIGVHVVREIERRGPPPGVICIDAGTAAFEALYAASGADSFVVIDAVKAGGRPGDIYRMDIKQWKLARSVSLHDVQFLDALTISALLDGKEPHVVVVGIEPSRIAPGLELSDALKERFDDLLNAVLLELEGGKPDDRI